MPTLVVDRAPPTVKFAISSNAAAYGTDRDAVIRVARHAEQCGFESFLVPEHLVLRLSATQGGYEVPPTLAVEDPLELPSTSPASLIGACQPTDGPKRSTRCPRSADRWFGTPVTAEGSQAGFGGRIQAPAQQQ